MNITGRTGYPSSTYQSILKSANKQPELALQLLQKSLEGLTSQNSQAPSNAASQVTLQEKSLIDIRA